MVLPFKGIKNTSKTRSEPDLPQTFGGNWQNGLFEIGGNWQSDCLLCYYALNVFI